MIDSLETWASIYAEQATLMLAVSGLDAAFKLVLAGTNAAGDVERVARLRRVEEAVVVLDATSWFVRKCRWLPGCPQRFPRQRPDDGGEPSDEEPPRLLH